MNPFRDKSVCVVGNVSIDILIKNNPYYRLPAESNDWKTNVRVYCNRLPIRGIQKCWQQVVFWDSCEEFDAKKHDFRGVDFVYIYALRPDANELIEYLRSKNILRSTYCPACRNEHEDRHSIEGIHWALPLTNRLQGRPFTGFLAIYKALIDGAKSITVTGFDFYRNSNGWQTCVGPHNIENHVRWLKEMVETEGSRIRLADDVKIAMDDYFKWKSELKTD